MGARRTARERALQALYQVEMAPGSTHEALEAAWAAEVRAFFSCPSCAAIAGGTADWD